MKKAKYGLFIIVPIVLILVSVIVFKINNPEPYTITLMANSGIAYSWEYELSDDDIVSVKKESKALNDNDGGSVEVYFKIKPKKEGTATLLLNYESQIADAVARSKEYNIVVDENLNISVTEK